jgi:hypothetical protein
MTDHPKRIASLLNVTPELLREFIAHLSKPDDETVTLYAQTSRHVRKVPTPDSAASMSHSI